MFTFYRYEPSNSKPWNSTQEDAKEKLQYKIYKNCENYIPKATALVRTPFDIKKGVLQGETVTNALELRRHC